MKLKLEDLRVDSFATEEAGEEQRGTVEAHQITWPRLSCPAALTCPECADPAP